MTDKQHYSAEEKAALLSWDPDFTKLTAEERQQLDEANAGGFVAEEDIDWSSIGR